jgi:formate hydrogenlyase subunit 3/multisubunit Na+/H+ antiporter MnhD subunit
MGFLGMSRSESAAKAVEAKTASVAPMIFLAVLCLLLGVLPTYIIPALNRELQPWTEFKCRCARAAVLRVESSAQHFAARICG